jgi:hypothetical protein
MGRLVLGGPESSIVDVPNLLRGFRFSQKSLWPEASRLNLLKLAPALQMPVFFFRGRQDSMVLKRWRRYSSRSPASSPRDGRSVDWIRCYS